MDFKYKVTVIVPVYNVKKYLRDCLDSLIAQTISHDKMEVLLINDGSTDNSPAICNKYAKKHSFFKVFNKENGGPAAARNLGLAHAEGKFILFLDSDDKLSCTSVENIVNFFEEVYDEVDLVTYPLKKYDEKWELTKYNHYRFSFLKKDGVYDLEKYPYITQTTMNICVKNKLEKNTLFDSSFLVHEDQKYINQVLSEKMKIGFCQDAEYMYLAHEGSIMSVHSSPIELWEPTIAYYEFLFNQYEHVPPYFQGMFIHDINWKLKANMLFPYHYKKEQFDEAIGRIKALMEKVDTDIIINHPSMDVFHHHFWISLKKNAHPTVILNTGDIYIGVDGKTIYHSKKMEIVLSKVDVKKGVVSVLGFVKSPIFNYIKDIPEVIAFVNNKRFNVPAFESINGCYKSKTRTNNFWGFRFSFKSSDNDKLFFIVKFNGVELKTRLNCAAISVFNKKIGITSFVRDGYLLSLRNNTIEVSKISQEEQYDLEANRSFSVPIPEELSNLRNKVLSSQKKNRIWIYSDHHTIGAENGFYQFQHDFEKEDGIDRYYICDGNMDEIKELCTNKQSKHLIEFESDIHKSLYFKAEYSIVSFIDVRPRLPLEEADMVYLRDLHQPTVIYLQHGVLHADLRWMQSAERCKFDKIVVSSEFEQNNLINKYNYRPEDILPFGMPRYNHIDKSRKAKNRIIFAPSWRSYLVRKNTDALWEGNTKQLLKSKYFTKFIAFLSSPELADFLEKNNLYLDAKLHQNMKSAIDLFEIKSDRVSIVDGKVDVEDYKIFMTDISSYVFDYAYLSRPVVYFVPDIEEIESGISNYRKLDLPFEEAFGNLVLEPKAAIEELKRIAENNFIPDDIFKKRMDNFFLPMDDCEEKLYKYLMKEN